MSDLRRLKRRFPVFFVNLTGGDYQLLLKSGEEVIRKHYYASLSLLAVMLTSAVSVFYATDLLFHFWQAEIFLALFITALFACIYIFLLTTLSKFTREGKKWKLSNLVRLGFVLFMAFLISKPVEVLVFSASIKPQVEVYKQRLYKSYEEKLNTLFSSDLEQLQEKQNLLEARFQLYPSNEEQEQIKQLQTQLTGLLNSKGTNLQLAVTRIAKSDFLLFRIQQIVRQPLAWIVCAGIILLFFLPGYFIYSIKGESPFYQLKEEAARSIIQADYQLFEEKYSSIFLHKWNVQTTPYTVYEDPPFNSIRRSTPEYQTNVEFVSRYLGKYGL